MQPMPADAPPHDRSTLATWIDDQRAIFDRWLEAELTQSPSAAGLSAPCSRTGNLSEALSASARATLRAEEDLIRRWAERVAADSRSSKLVVEAAHQAYELALSCTSTKAAFYNSWFASLRAVETAPFTGTWLGVFRAWRALAPNFAERRPTQTSRADFDGRPAATIEGEEPAAPENGRH